MKLIRWLLVGPAVLVWLLVVPIVDAFVELVKLGGRLGRRPRPDERLPL